MCSIESTNQEQECFDEYQYGEISHHWSNTLPLKSIESVMDPTLEEEFEAWLGRAGKL